MFLGQHLLDLLQILLIAVAVYHLLRLMRGTRTAHILMGLSALVLILIALTQLFSLDVVSHILQTLSVYLVITLVIVFHPEIRRVLALLGQQSFSSLLRGAPTADSPMETLADATILLSERRIGALIAVERQEMLNHYEETGIALDARLSPELLLAIFTPPLPLHDGGIIVRGGRILAAHCMFPLSHNAALTAGLGTRHRAALGLSEDTDALIIVVSEENGAVSVAHDGQLRRAIAPHNLRRFLRAVFVPKERRSDAFALVFGRGQNTPARGFNTISDTGRRA